jgi:hypothetical protein
MILNRNTFKSEIKHHFLTNHPDIYQKVNGKVMNDALAFVDGFESCLSFFKEEPYKEEEIREFLKAEAIKRIIKSIVTI